MHLVYKYKVAIYYLTNSIEKGYNDASYELEKAHQFLSKWYSDHGGRALALALELPKQA
jgi:hypothetical protein